MRVILLFNKIKTLISQTQHKNLEKLARLPYMIMPACTTISVKENITSKFFTDVFTLNCG